jgi:ubiquitin carboxyl-terminal hydrolase L5
MYTDAIILLKESLRRMDMLNADLGLQNDFEKWEKSRKNPKRKKAPNNNRKKKDEEEPGFHFIAYVPINGSVWRLDGLQRQPVNLGKLCLALRFHDLGFPC